MSRRVLALDFGMRRIGLAVSDALGITAQGLPTLERTRIADDLEHIAGVVREYEVERIILGNPIGHSGNETSMSRRVAEFREKLGRRLDCPVELWDERLTSAQAGRVLRESGMGIEKRRRAVDRVAATLLLEGYLEYQASQRARRETGETPGDNSGADE